MDYDVTVVMSPKVSLHLPVEYMSRNLNICSYYLPKIVSDANPKNALSYGGVDE